MSACLFGARHGAKAFSHLMLTSVKEVLFITSILQMSKPKNGVVK